MSHQKEKIIGMMGYSPEDASIVWEKMEVIIEVGTNGTGHDGYPESQTIGIAVNQYHDLVLFVSSKHDKISDKCSTLIMGTDCTRISDALRELADEIDHQGVTGAKALANKIQR